MIHIYGRPALRFPHTHAGRRTKFAPVKSLNSSEFSSEFSDLKTLLSDVKVNPVISRNVISRNVISRNGHNSFHRIFSFEFSGFFYTSNFLRILRILLHLKQFSYKTTPDKRLENSPFSRNLVAAERKRRGQGGVIWTEYHTRSDANHIDWINLIQSNTTHLAKLGLMRCKKVTLIPSPLK